jgi:hypothetical protein
MVFQGYAECRQNRNLAIQIGKRTCPGIQRTLDANDRFENGLWIGSMGCLVKADGHGRGQRFKSTALRIRSEAVF